MKVRDVMTKDVVAVHTHTPFRALVELLDTHRVSGLPVVDDDGRVLGMVSGGDLLLKEHRAQQVRIHTPVETASELAEHTRRTHGMTAGALMTTPAVSVDENANLRAAARLMTLHGIRRLPVTTDGRLAGILTRGDVLKVFLRPDADIASDISTVLGRVGIDTPELDVTVDEGVVYLRGHVPARSTANLVTFHADRCDGVANVVDELTFELDDLELATVTPPPIGPLEHVL